MPECFKASVDLVHKLTSMSDFSDFKAKSSRVAEDQISTSAEVYSLSRILNRSNSESVSQIEFRTLLKLTKEMPFSFIVDHIRSTENYKNWMSPLTQ